MTTINFEQIAKDLGRPLTGLDKAKIQRRAEQNQLCGAGKDCKVPGQHLPYDPRKLDLAHKISKSAVTRGEADREDIHLFDKDGNLTENAVVLHPVCNQTQGIYTLAELGGRAAIFPNWRPVRMFVDERKSAQQARMRWWGRMCQADRLDDPKMYAIAEPFYENYLSIEKALTKELSRRIEGLSIEDPILLAIQQVPGVGPVLAARIMCDIRFEKAPHVSNLYRFAGYGVNDEGKREYGEKGHSRAYNGTLKIALRNTVDSFVKLGSEKSFYAQRYRNRRHFTEHAVHWKDRKRGHRHNDAIGITAKLLLSHLWEEGRKIENLPMDGPYAIERLGHEGYISPQQAGWPTEEELKELIEKLVLKLDKREKRATNAK